MKPYSTFFISFLLLINITLSGQSLSPYVFALSGGYVKSPAGDSFSWTIGEPVVDLIRSEDFLLAQGFQQPELKLDTRYVHPSFVNDLLVYPNPTHAEVILQSDYEGRILLRLTDLSGKSLGEDTWAKTHTLNLADLSPGLYPIYFLIDNQLVRTEMISKN